MKKKLLSEKEKEKEREKESETKVDEREQELENESESAKKEKEKDEVQVEVEQKKDEVDQKKREYFACVECYRELMEEKENFANNALERTDFAKRRKLEEEHCLSQWDERLLYESIFR